MWVLGKHPNLIGKEAKAMVKTPDPEAEARMAEMDAKAEDAAEMLQAFQEKYPEAAKDFGEWMRTFGTSMTGCGLKRAGRLVAKL